MFGIILKWHALTWIVQPFLMQMVYYLNIERVWYLSFSSIGKVREFECMMGIEWIIILRLLE